MKWIALFLLLSGGPVLLASLFPPEGWRFFGGLINPDDISVYLAAMYQGGRGLWLYHSPFDPTPAVPLLMYPLYLLLGKAAALLQADLTLTFHVCRLACGVLTLVVIGHWNRILFEQDQDRTSAWILTALSSGIGPAETSVFLATLAAPHFGLGVGLEALALLTYWRATTDRRWAVWAMGSGAALLGLGLTYPFTVPVAYGVMGSYVLWTWWRLGRQLGSRALRAALIAGGIPIPLLVYYARVFFFDTFWQETHVAQNVIPTPGLGSLLVRYGLLLALAIWGFVRVWKSRDREGLWILISIWALINGFMLYLPITFQWRLANGWHLALAFLATLGLEEGIIPWIRRSRLHLIWRRISRRPVETTRRVILLLTLPATLITLLASVRIVLQEPDPQFYVRRDALEAMNDLTPYVDLDNVVLGAYRTGNTLPSQALCRVVAGQGFATRNLQEKMVHIARFFNQETPDAERQEILDRYDVTVVYYGQWEQELGEFDPSGAPYLSELLRTGETVVYRVTNQSR